MPLSEKQTRFAQEYVKDLNGTQAAIRAGYSERTANEQAARLLAKVSIQNEVKRLQAEIAERNKVTIDRVVNELALIAFADMRDFARVDEDGAIRVKRFDTIEGDKTRVIRKIKEKITTTSNDGETSVQAKPELELHDKMKALELLGKHLGMFNDKGKQEPSEPISTEEDPFVLAIAERAASDWAETDGIEDGQASSVLEEAESDPDVVASE